MHRLGGVGLTTLKSMLLVGTLGHDGDHDDDVLICPYIVEFQFRV